MIGHLACFTQNKEMLYGFLKIIISVQTIQDDKLRETLQRGPEIK